MGNKVIRQSIFVSESMDALDAAEERFFYRLLLTSDDHGRFEADSRILIANCFPLKIGDVSRSDVDSWLAGLEREGIVEVYTVDGKRYGLFTNWEKHNKLRNQKSRHPGPEAVADNCVQPSAIENNRQQLKTVENSCDQLLLARTGDALHDSDSDSDSEGREIHGKVLPVITRMEPDPPEPSPKKPRKPRGTVLNGSGSKEAGKGPPGEPVESRLARLSSVKSMPDETEDTPEVAEKRRLLKAQIAAARGRSQ